MEFGISTACFYPAYVEEAVEELSRHDVRLIEIFANTYTELKPEFLRKLKQQMDAYEMNMISLHPFTSGFEPFLLFTPYERRFQDGLEEYRRFFFAAAELGAQYLVFHGNWTHSPFPDEQYYERFALLREEGKKLGVRLAQENVAPYKSREISFLKGLRAYLHDDVDFVLDVKQAVRAGQQVNDFVDAIGDKVCHLHLSDHNQTQDCLPIGAGKFDFVDFFVRMKAKGFEGTAVLELYRENYGAYEELYESLDRLKKWAQLADCAE